MREENHEPFKSFVGERGGTAHDCAKTGKVKLPSLGTLTKHDNDGRDLEEVADLVLGDALEHTSGAGFGHYHGRAAGAWPEEQSAGNVTDI